MSDEKEKSIKIIEFSGKYRDFPFWEPKWLARASRKKYKPLITGKKAIPSMIDYDTAVAKDETQRSPDEKAIVKWYELGMDAYDDLLMSMNSTTDSGKVAFMTVKNSKTVENPEGDAHKAWKRLSEKYAPKTSSKLINYDQEFANMKMVRWTDDPDIFITRMEALVAEMNEIKIPGKSDKTETDLILHVIGNLPKEYDQTQADIHKELKRNPSTTDIQYIREALEERYDQLKKQRKQEPRGGESALVTLMEEMQLDEKAFVAWATKQFKGRCNSCGVYGHKGVDCPSKGQAQAKTNESNSYKNKDNNNSGGERFNGTCHHCGLYGHRSRDCRKTDAQVKAMKTQREVAQLVLGEGDSNDVDDSIEWSENESIDELGFYAVDCLDDGPDQPSVSARPCKKRVAFNDHIEVITTSFGQSLSEEPEPLVCSRPKKRYKKESWVSTSENTTTEGVSELCFVASDFGESHPRNDVTHTRRSENESRTEFGTNDGDRYPKFTDHTHYVDTCASCTMDKDARGLKNAKIIKEYASGFGGAQVKTSLMGSKTYRIKQVDGSSVTKTFYPVKIAPKGELLLSVTAEITRRGAKLATDENNDLVLTYPDGSVIKGDRHRLTKTGYVPGVEMIPVYDDDDVKEVCNLQTSLETVEEVDETPYIKSENVMEFHKQMCHPNIVATKATAKSRKVKLTGTPKPCKPCAIGKARQKGVSKTPVKRASEPGERFFIDISSPRVRSIGGNQHMLLGLDDYSDLAFCFPLPYKDLLKMKLIPFIKDLKAKYGITVKIIRCDNAGENIAFEKASKQEGLGLTFEYTAVNTPQQNGRVERKFQTLWGRVRAMLIDSGIENPLRNKLWSEAFNTATDMDGVLVRSDGQTAFDNCFGKGRKSHISTTRKFGEQCVVTDRTKIKAKLTDKGKVMWWLGYAVDHAKDTYRLLNKKTQKVVLSRDVVFTPEQEGEDPKAVIDGNKEVIENDSDFLGFNGENEDDVPVMGISGTDSDNDCPPLFSRVDGEIDTSDEESSSDDDDNDEDDGDRVSFQINRGRRNTNTLQANRTAEVEVEKPINNPKVIRAMRKLDASYNPEARHILEQSTVDPESQDSDDLETGRDDNPREADDAEEEEEVNMISLLSKLSNYLCELSEITIETDDPNEEIKQPSDEKKPDYVAPKTFSEAWFHPDPYQQKLWREAIRKEYSDMDKREVWTVTKRSEIPSNRRVVKTKWVFTIKRNGIFRARLVACGYSQIPGVDFTENYSPVVNDVSFRLLLLAMLMFGLSGKIADVETAFLYGDLEEDIYMECPAGMIGVTKDDVLSLNKCIYGLVQAARQYHKKVTAILRNIGFSGGDVDPCLFCKKTDKGICLIAMYVDDNLLVGHPAAIQDTIEQLRKNGLILKIEDDLHDYLSCEIIFSSDRKSAWLGQPYLIANLEKKFGDQVKGLRTYLTPGTPSLNQNRPEDPALHLPAEKQKMYRSGVGMLLWLVKHSRPDIANCVRELSKVLDFSTEESYKELLRIIKYVLDTKQLGLKLKPTGERNEPWQMECFTDSDYAGDPVSRRSVTGYIIYILGVPICWKSSSQKSVTLSSCEAEWVALSEAVKDIIFIINLCDSMQIKIQLPVTVRVDNIGAIFMTQNVTTISRTKHVDVMGKYVREYAEDGVIKIVFVRSEDNDSDIMTKNLASELYGKHSKKLLGSK